MSDQEELAGIQDVSDEENEIVQTEEQSDDEDVDVDVDVDDEGGEEGEEEGEEEDEEDDEEGEEEGEEDGEGEDEETKKTDEETKKKSKKGKKKALTLSSTNTNYNVDNELFTEYQEFEKIDENLKNSYIKSYHPELIHKNYDEMMKLTFLKRNDDGIINDPLHKTLPFLTKYEKTKIIGLRVKQLNSGSRPFINIKDIFKTNIVYDTNLIAERELSLKKIPFIIARPITHNHTEYWNLKDIELI